MTKTRTIAELMRGRLLVTVDAETAQTGRPATSDCPQFPAGPRAVAAFLLGLAEGGVGPFAGVVDGGLARRDRRAWPSRHSA